MWKMKKIRKSDDAVAGVIIALLLFGLIVTVLSTIQLVYVPQWVEEQEGIHMHEVADQFAQLKYATDIQTLAQGKTPISSPITLGTEKQSFLTTSRSYGSVYILSDSLTFAITNDTSSSTNNLGIIKYASKNSYYVNQNYVFEGGGIIINQSQGNIMSSDPSVVLNDGDFELSFTLINVTAFGGKTSVSGYGTYAIKTNYSDSSNKSIYDINTIVVSTNHPNAWHLFMNNTLQNLGLSYSSDFTIDVAGSSITVTIDDATVVDVSLDIVKIFCQIAPGWVR